MLSTYISYTKAIVVSSVILGAALVYKACNVIVRMNQMNLPTLCNEPAIAKPSREGETVVVMDTTTGERNGLDCYVVGALIGSGSYSQVFRAEDLKSKRVIALKVYKMKKERHLYEEAASEMAFLRFLNHENIITFIACDIKKENMYLATEYSEFGCFTKIIHQVEPLPEEFIQLVMKQLISALAYLHSMHIMHGDVKPENIIISHFCPFTIKLNDFGLTEVLYREIRIAKVGSFFYMAPELHLSSPCDSTADLYSAGIVMYELIYGKKPFPTNITEDAYTAMMIKQAAIEYPEERTSGLSTECMDLLKGLLSYEKDKRHFGNRIVHHPFLDIGDIIPSNLDHYNEGYKCLIKSIDLAKEQLYGPAYIEVTQAILHFKIYCKSVIPDDMALYAYLRNKMMDYVLLSKKIKNLMLSIDNNFVEPFFMPMQTEKLRCMLTSVPHLLAAYDLCLIGEMCIAKTDKGIGLIKLRDGLNKLSAILPKEPDSEYKNLLLKKHTEWSHYVESLEAMK